MTYPGGKNGSGVYQAIINQMPPHRVYVEAFLGGGAIMRAKRPAAVNIGLDLDANAVTNFTAADHTASFGDVGRFEIMQADAVEFLRDNVFRGDELVYCDPPYVHSTRTKLNLYNFEMTDEEHRALLAVLRGLPCMVMISGYESELYRDTLADWHHITFQAMTRGGRPATEWLWMNFAPPVELHDYQFLGADYRERERIKKKKDRLTKKLRAMPRLERQAMLAAIQEAWPDAPPEMTMCPGASTAESGGVRCHELTPPKLAG